MILAQVYSGGSVGRSGGPDARRDQPRTPGFWFDRGNEEDFSWVQSTAGGEVANFSSPRLLANHFAKHKP